MKKTTPSDLEMQILSVLWDKGPSTARQVLKAMPDGKKRAYTSILSVLQVMEKKKLVNHTSKANSYIYKPLKSKETIIKPFMKQLVNHVFGGSRLNLVQSLLGSSRLSEKELAELEKLLDQNKK